MPEHSEQPLSLGLREATAAAHRAAEGRRFVGALLRGEIPTPTYARYLQSLLLGYRALEDALDAGQPQLCAVFPEPGLRRVPALEADLTALGMKDAEPVDAGRAWAVHLAGLRADAPGRLVAHAYTRYLGDLSGGQMIGARLQKLWGPDAALAFYAFPDIDDAGACKQGIRARLDALGEALGSAGRAAVLAEAVRAFEMSAAIFDQLST